MKYRLYLDAFFLLNLFMDTLLLSLVKRVLGRTATRLRLLLSGAFGAGTACALTLVSWIPAWLKLLAGYGLVSIAMVRLAFCRLPFRLALKGAVYLYGFAFLLGGALELLLRLISLGGGKMGLLGLCAASLCVYAAFLHFYKARRERRGCTPLPVCLIWKERKAWTSALVDTGNHLYEPISQKAVSVVEKGILEGLFAGEPPQGFRAVPYSSIGRKRGILSGYEITALIIEEGEKKIRIEKPIVGAFDGRLSTDAAYQMILHPTLTKWQEESI